MEDEPWDEPPDSRRTELIALFLEVLQMSHRLDRRTSPGSSTPTSPWASSATSSPMPWTSRPGTSRPYSPRPRVDRRVREPAAHPARTLAVEGPALAPLSPPVQPQLNWLGGGLIFAVRAYTIHSGDSPEVQYVLRTYERSTATPWLDSGDVVR